ncbi:hypothetical protein IFO69_11925 [Echinicola sp. CAU 1574]|uniref:Uncharacterized protein n=1 Tax=Echinicola arenosa TaxID=2774144 RepID=A0ABR9ANL0_9BACT|nr:hypothetical protein [Echinicola arenosa]MBD8489453.1 hypothetical protein [Echinicola arenosa]
MMKKLILMFAMVFMAFSSSFAYDNGIGVMATPWVSADSDEAVINDYCEIRFYYVIHRADPDYQYSGSVFLRQGGFYVAGTAVSGGSYPEPQTMYSSTELFTGQWYTLTLSATSNNAYAHGQLNW